MRPLTLIYVGSGWGAPDRRTGKGPYALAPVLNHALKSYNPEIFYTDYHHPHTYHSYTTILSSQVDYHKSQITFMADNLCQLVRKVVSKNHFPIIIGGDHSISLGTWSGVRLANLNHHVGLMWFGAHMDAHTFETSVSQAPHGMSFASLIGQGCPEWVKLGGVGGKVAPHQAVQIGVRSFEAAEAALLKSHHVTVFSQEQINTFGLKSIFQSAYDQIVQTTPWFGVSLDINVFDPTQAPGTGTPEPNGVDYRSFLPLVKGLAYQEHCLAFEIAEFNPDKDQEDKTLNLILQLVQTVLTP